MIDLKVAESAPLQFDATSHDLLTPKPVKIEGYSGTFPGTCDSPQAVAPIFIELW